MSDECWGYSDHWGPERWTGAFPSREAAIETALSELDGDVVFIQRGLRSHPLEFVPDASTIVDLIAEAAYEEADDLAEDWPDVNDDAEKELDALLQAWATRNLNPCSFGRPRGT